MNIDRQRLIDKIRGIDALTKDEKSALLELLNKGKRYGLVWEDKPENVEERLCEELPVLTEVKEKAIISEDPDAPNHILIEGDNLEALTALTYTHSGKIDVIYIDPPYNTGNKDFVYNDTFVDGEDSFRHSKWLSFMSKRLMIAKNLMSDKGVIFISIDDNEQAQLKLLCDEVFGENNFFTNVLWQSTPGSNTGKAIKTVTEYVLMFAKSKSAVEINSKPDIDIEKYKFRDFHLERRGPYILNKLDRRMTGSHYSEALNYPVQMPDGTFLYPGCLNERQEHWNWRWSMTKVNWGIANDFIVFNKKNGKWAIYFKQYLKVDNNDTPIERKLPYQNLILAESMNAARGTREVMDIFSEKKFDYPKPLNLVTYVLGMVTKPNSIILDFFAGSGTTLHATMKLNAEDGGHRKCILVTNNENNICEEVTYERNKRVINGYVKPNGEEVDGLTHNTLRYYRIDYVGRERTSRNMRQLVYAATDLLCIKEDLYNEVKQFGSLKLKSSVARYFESNDKRMLVIYNELAVPTIAAEIAKMELSDKVKIYVFAPGNYAYDDEFFEVQNKVELCAFPAAIYNAYQKVLPKRETRLLDGAQNGIEPEENNSELNLNYGEE